jgi:hypothetical protein
MKHIFWVKNQQDINFSEVGYLMMLSVSRLYSINDRMINNYEAADETRMKL